MKRKLTNNEVYTVICAEEELGRTKLIYELYNNNNVDVYTEVNKNGVIDIDTWELRKKGNKDDFKN